MDCLVTGGAGFIGSHLVDALVARGDRVVVLDDLSSGRRGNLTGALAAGATLREVDVRDAGAVDAVFAAHRPELVFHLAAQIDVRVSVAAPAADVERNVLGTIAVLEAARRHGARRLVNSSTGGGVYGDAETIPTPESAPIQPLAPYGLSKYTAEAYCALYASLHGLSTVSLRYGNVYGPRQDSHGEAGVVAVFCGLLRAGRAPTVYGDGCQTRDWVAVADVVAANLRAAQTELTGAINIGHGQETSVLDLIAALAEIGGGTAWPQPAFAPARAGEVRRSCLDVTRARVALGWSPVVPFADGLQATLAAMS